MMISTNLVNYYGIDVYAFVRNLNVQERTECL